VTLPTTDLPSFEGYVVHHVHRGGAVHKGRVSIAERDGVACVVKDIGPMRPLLRWLYGRRNLAREAWALEKLEAFEGTPRLLDRISKDAIAVEYVPTRHKYLRSGIPADEMPAVLRAFESTVDALHDRGFVHLDLRQRKNVLVVDVDRVVLIDLESARDVSQWLGRLLRPWLVRIDAAAVLKWKVKFAPELCTPRELARADRYARRSALWPWKRFGRVVRRWFGDDTAR